MRAARALAPLLLLAALAAPPALADGDPASDVLFSQQVFLPFSAKLQSADVQDLTNTVAAANERGVKVRVAIIASKVDLGAVPALFGKPERYARFLGGEISFGWKGLVLVVMPAGLGISRSFHPAPKQLAIVRKVQPQEGIDGLARSGATAVRRLAAAEGERLPPAPERRGGGSTTHDRVVIALAALLGALLAVGLVLLARRRSRPPRG